MAVTVISSLIGYDYIPCSFGDHMLWKALIWGYGVTFHWAKIIYPPSSVWACAI
jgi:hypothetical protein